jgi:hypothetical protein
MYNDAHFLAEHQTFGPVAIALAKKRGFNFLWDSKEGKPISVSEARKIPPAHVRLFDNDPIHGLAWED